MANLISFETKHATMTFALNMIAGFQKPHCLDHDSESVPEEWGLPIWITGCPEDDPFLLIFTTQEKALSAHAELYEAMRNHW